mmetsp:Transcript_19612/g.34812  ORF Transcript_19612/g.34812 Transcript_19612/m.34812 type:complete len:95 (-) Transcript_19612:390-674(-)
MHGVLLCCTVSERFSRRVVQGANSFPHLMHHNCCMRHDLRAASTPTTLWDLHERHCHHCSVCIFQAAYSANTGFTQQTFGQRHFHRQDVRPLHG